MNPVRARDRLETFVILAPRNECGCVTRGDLLTSIYVIFVLFVVRSFVYIYLSTSISSLPQQRDWPQCKKVPEKSSFLR